MAERNIRILTVVLFMLCAVVFYLWKFTYPSHVTAQIWTPLFGLFFVSLYFAVAMRIWKTTELWIGRLMFLGVWFVAECLASGPMLMAAGFMGQ